jgi:hypothetical protein
LRDWTSLLEKHSRVIQGVYVRLSTLHELGELTPYKVHIIVAAPAVAKKEPDWALRRDTIEREIEAFWQQFTPGIDCIGVDVLSTDELTLSEIEQYQRFDADWVSFANDTPFTRTVLDMTT